MAKVKEITIGGSYTFQVAQYHPLKGEAHVTMTVEPEDNLEDVQVQASQYVAESIIAMMAGINVIHTKLFSKGHKIEDLAKEIEGGEILLDDDDGSWKI